MAGNSPSGQGGPFRHSLLEDGHALALASLFIAVGIAFLKAAGLFTGGLAGAALLLSYCVKIPVSVIFFALNAPFYYLAWRFFGRGFAVKTFLTNLLLVSLGLLIPNWLRLATVQPLFAALFGGALIGFGIMALARHGSSVGGTGVVAIYMQERRGVSAGLVQLVFDLLIVGAGFLVIAPDKVLLSILSAATLSGVLMINHRPGRYMAHSFRPEA
ncbi:MAG: YitT family protein [Caulobacter sp.]